MDYMEGYNDGFRCKFSRYLGEDYDKGYEDGQADWFSFTKETSEEEESYSEKLARIDLMRKPQFPTRLRSGP